MRSLEQGWLSSFVAALANDSQGKGGTWQPSSSFWATDSTGNQSFRRTLLTIYDNSSGIFPPRRMRSAVKRRTTTSSSFLIRQKLATPRRLHDLYLQPGSTPFPAGAARRGYTTHVPLRLRTLSSLLMNPITRIWPNAFWATTIYMGRKLI
jgi:hypothetical protein